MVHMEGLGNECLEIVNKIEWDLFSQVASNVDNDEVFEKLRSCTPKACVAVIGKEK